MACNLAWRTEGRLFVCVHGKRDPTNLEWQRYVNFARELTVRELDLRILVLSRGGSPNGDQRRALMTAIGRRTEPVAMLTDSVIARTVVFAMRVFNPTMKAFATTEIDQASEFLGLTPSEQRRAVVLLREIEREIVEPLQVSPPNPPVG